jgi:hypothetical protein
MVTLLVLSQVLRVQFPAKVASLFERTSSYSSEGERKIETLEDAGSIPAGSITSCETFLEKASYSSMVEHGIADPLVAGSNPAGRFGPLVITKGPCGVVVTHQAFNLKSRVQSPARTYVV